jgi:CheY-like chemotaxis protein
LNPSSPHIMCGFVLIVDDDPAIREAVCELLADEGHRAIGVANGQEALDLLRSGGRPGMILLDLMMPVMDGMSFRAKQLEDPVLGAIPVAVITASDRRAAASMNVEAVLPKPLDIDELLRTIQRLCASPSTL